MFSTSQVPCPVSRAAFLWPDASGVVNSGGLVSFADLDARVAGMVVRLREMGIGLGDRVAIRFRNDVSYLVLLFALLRVGAVACLISTRWPEKTVSEARIQLRCRFLFRDSDPASKSDSLTVEMAKVMGTGARRGSPSFLSMDRLATIIFTSGSTGKSKAAAHAIRQHYFSAIGSNANIALSPGDRWLLSLPLYHVGGLAIPFRCWLAGASVVIPESGQALDQSIEEYSATHASMVTTQVLRCVNSGTEGWARSLKAILLGGSEIPTAVRDICRSLPIHTTYGLTEMTSQVATSSAGRSVNLEGYAGHILPYRNVCIAADSEILVRGETLFEGYVTDDRVRPAVDREGWFHTRDLGRLRGDRDLCVLGRKDNMFISGGENIYPEEIERALLVLPNIRQACVVPVPDEEYGSRPVAFIEMEGGCLEPERVRKNLASLLPKYKIPVRIYAWPSLEAGSGIKVDRMKMKQFALERKYASHQEK